MVWDSRLIERALITGGNGVIGSHLADALLAERCDVILYDIHFNWHTAHASSKVLGDVVTCERLRELVGKVDVVLHLAAVSTVAEAQRDPMACLRVNVEGTLSVAQLSAELGKPFVYASSREVYGNPEDLPVREDSPKNPLSIYGTSKLAGELLLNNLRRTQNLKYLIIRLSNVFGSTRDIPTRVIPRFVRSALDGAPLTVFGGEQVLDFTFIDDVVQNVMGLLDRIDRIEGEDYNLASGRGISVVDLAQTVRELTGSSSEVAKTSGRAFDVERFIGDATKARKLLGEEYSSLDFQRALEIYVQRVRESTD